MKFLVKVLIILLALFIALKLIIHIFDKGHKKEYTIGNFTITEVLKTDKVDNYYFKINHEKFKMNFQIFKNYNKEEKIISDIKYYDGNYQCILPFFKGEILTDIMCLKDNTITYYHNLKDGKVDEFASEMKKYGYDSQIYKEQGQAEKVSNMMELYKDNLVQNHYLALESYKGITLINNEKEIKLFKNDVYKKPVSIFTDKYYIVADYDQEYSFKKFYVVNLINGNVKEIRSYNEISLDSIMQGVVNNEIYLFDKDAEVQYKINLKQETVEKLDNIKFYKGKWTNITTKEALEGNKFENYYSNQISGFDKVDKVDKYYYLYKKKADKYLVYRADTQNPKIKTYLFTTSEIHSVMYLKDYIYFKNDTFVYYYSDKGERKVIDNLEIEFNNDIDFGVYIK